MEGPTLMLVGSVAPGAQATVLADEDTLVLTLPREAVLSNDETYLMAIRSAAAAAIFTGRTVVVRSENWPGAREVTQRLAAKRFLPPGEVERRVRIMLARVGEGVLKATLLRRLVVVGTDTGEAVAAHLRETYPEFGAVEFTVRVGDRQAKHT